MKIETSAIVQSIREVVKPTGKTTSIREQVVTFAIRIGERTVLMDFNFPLGTISRDQLWKTWNMSITPPSKEP